MASKGIKDNVQEDKVEKEKVEMIKRLTSYDDTVVYEKLIEHNGDYEKVIKEFMGAPQSDSVEKKESTTLNQEIFKQIRNHMDEASQGFYR